MKKKGKYPSPKRIKSGRNLFVVDYDNKTPLIGLSWDSGNGQYYYTFWKSEKDVQSGKKNRKDFSFGVDYQSAVFKFKQWRRETQRFSLMVPTDETELKKEITVSTDSFSRIRTGFGNDNVIKEIPPSITFPLEKEIGKDFYPTPHKLQSTITTDRQYALHLLKQLLQDEELRIEAIRLLKLNEFLPKDFKPLPIQSILDFYKEHNTCSKKEKGQIKTAVKHFMNITQRKNINDITETDIELFRDVIKKSKKSDTYIEGRLNRVKTALNYYLENKPTNDEKELVRKVYALCKEKLKTSSPIPDESPLSIDIDTLKVIFQKAINDSELSLMFLLMLNTAFYPVDIRQLKKSMIKTKDKITYIVHRRTKTKQTYIRVDCLWDITANLLKKHYKTHPNSQFIFVTSKGGGYAEGTLGKKFRRFFQEISHSDGSPISAKHFRDTVASTLAFDVHPNIIKVTMGHSIKGSKDEFWKYVENRPEQQKPASDILYQKFKTVIKMVGSYSKLVNEQSSPEKPVKQLKKSFSK